MAGTVKQQYFIPAAHAAAALLVAVSITQPCEAVCGLLRCSERQRARHFVAVARSSLASVTGFNRLSASRYIRDIDYSFKSSTKERGMQEKVGIEAEKRGGKSASQD